MAKHRFRDVKQGKVTKDKGMKKSKKDTIPYASSKIKIKAFLTDSFMIFMPIFYFIIYVIFDNLKNAGEHKLEAWSYALVAYFIIQTIFMIKDKARTPGLRSQNLKVIDKYTKQKPSLFSIVFRNLTSILSLLTIFGWVMMFFRKDNQTLHDLLSATAVVPDNEAK